MTVSEQVRPSSFIVCQGRESALAVSVVIWHSDSPAQGFPLFPGYSISGWSTQVHIENYDLLFFCHSKIRIKMKFSCCTFPKCLILYMFISIQRVSARFAIYHILIMIGYVLVTNLIFLTGLLLILGLRVIPVWFLVVCLKLENNTTSGQTLGKCFVLWGKNARVTQYMCVAERSISGYL